jgi:hypothetical protein
MRRRHRLSGAAATAAAVALSLGLIGPAVAGSAAPPPGSASAAGVPAHEIVFGAESPTPSILAAHEAVAGRTLNAVRLYRSWGQPLFENGSGNASYPMTLVQPPADRLLFISVLARTATKTVVPWAEIGQASPSTYPTIYSTIVSMATQIKQFVSACRNGGTYAGHTWPANGATDPGCTVYFTFNHEPEVGVNTAEGTGADFISAWRNIWNVFEQNGVCSVSVNPSALPAGLSCQTFIKYALITSAYGYARHDSFNVPEYYYPGDSYVDVIGADAYNWYTCHNQSWGTMAGTIAALRAFGLLHPTKPIVLTEWNSVEDPNALGSHKAQWIQAMESLLTGPGYRQFWGVLNWGQATSYGACAFGYDSSPQAAAAWATMGHDPAYQGPTIPQLLPFTVSGTMVQGGTPAWTATATLPAGTAYPGTLPGLTCTEVSQSGGPDQPVTAALAPGSYQIDPASCTSGNPDTAAGTPDTSYSVADYVDGGFTVTAPPATDQR